MTAAEEPYTDQAPKHPGGRPPKMDASPQTLQQLAGLGSIQATKPEIAAVFGVALPTLRIYFKKYPEALAAYENGKGLGKMSLRRRQWKMAEKNPTMAIWLGKNWLDQSDRAKHEHTGKNGGPLAVLDLSKLSGPELDAYEALCLKLGAEAADDDAAEDDDDAAYDGEPGDVSSGDAGGDPGGEGSEGYGTEPI